MTENLTPQQAESDPIGLIHNFGVDVDNRLIYLIGEINCDTFSEFVRNLNYLNSLSTDPIIIYFSSLGGEIHNGLGIYDAITCSLSPTVVIGYGELCSAATFVLQAATLRLLMPSTSFLVHSVSLSLDDNIKEVKAHISNTEKYYEIILNIYAQKMKKNIEFVRKWIDNEREVYLFPDEVVKLKLADGIFSKGKYKTLESIKQKFGV